MNTLKAPWPLPPSSSTAAAKPTQEPPPGEAPFYFTDGYWMSHPLDSSIYNCPWHRIEMALPQFPPGTHIEVQVFSYASLDLAPLSVRDDRWITTYSVVAPIQPPPDPAKPKTCVDEFLIQSSPAQYLSLLIKIHSDGFATPTIQKVRVHYPRSSYLAYLPPLYSANEPMRAFLDSFLSVFQTEWDEFDQRVDDSTALFDPVAVPKGVAMNYLASWLSVPLEGTWTGEQNRLLLEAAPKFQPVRGTAAALQKYVAVYLENFAGITPDVLSQTSFPVFLEGFRERQYLALSQASSKFGQAQPLWSDSVVKRLQLGGLAQEGQVDLVSTGDPQQILRILRMSTAFTSRQPGSALPRRRLSYAVRSKPKCPLIFATTSASSKPVSASGSSPRLASTPSCMASMAIALRARSIRSSLPPLNRLGYGTFLSCLPGAGPVILDADTRVDAWILD